MQITRIMGRYMGMLKDKRGGGWLASGDTRAEVIAKLLENICTECMSNPVFIEGANVCADCSGRQGIRVLSF